MASGFGGDAVRQINRLFRDGTAGALTDGQLLDRFTTRPAEAAEAAFEALVVRHGPMVLRVARGILRDPHDVDDAFQATFLVLVRKARSIGERELLGPWLYGVAHRVARKARGVAARRNKREGGVVNDDPPANSAEGPWFELRPMLHEELNRLPEKYRKPVILCHLQGLTHSEAAQELAWPFGTVSVRLARARKLLKERLSRRGLTVTASIWAAAMTIETASASVPESLIRSTTIAARAFETGQAIAAGMASAGAVALAKRTLTMMMISRLTWIAAPLVLGVASFGAVSMARPVPEASPGAPDRQATETGRPEPVKPLDSQPKVDRIETIPPLVQDASGALRIDPVPAGYFDLPAVDAQGNPGPSPVKVGQTIIVEVLEALPGRPITGERLIRPDGTISLGFYGDLKVDGLNRNQIKVKVIEHLCQYLSEEVLGLVGTDPKSGKARALPPVESTRVYVADDVDLPRTYAPANVGAVGIQEGQVIGVEVLEALPGRPISGQYRVGSDGTINLGFYGEVRVIGLKRDQIKAKVIEHLRKYLNDEILGLIVEDKQGQRRVVAAVDSGRVFVDDVVPQTRKTETFNELQNQVKDLNSKLDRVLKELEEMRSEKRNAKP